MPTRRFGRIALAQLLASGCAVVFGSCILIEYAQAQPGYVPPSPPPPVARLCSKTSQVLRACPTSRARSSSAYVLGLPDASRGAIRHGRAQDLPVPDRGASVRARGL